jgi:hypothetical protein
MAWKIRAYGSAQSISNLSFWAQLGSSSIKLELLGSAWLGLAQLDQKLLARPSLVLTLFSAVYAKDDDISTLEKSHHNTLKWESIHSNHD